MIKNVIYKICLEIIYLIRTYKEDLVLNNPQWLICLCIHLLVYHHAFSMYLLVEFSFVVLECYVWFLLLDLVLVSFKSPFFH